MSSFVLKCIFKFHLFELFLLILTRTYSMLLKWFCKKIAGVNNFYAHVVCKLVIFSLISCQSRSFLTLRRTLRFYLQQLYPLISPIVKKLENIKMFRKRMLKMLYLAFNVSGYFGGCPVTIDVDSQHFLIDKTIIQKLRRNFIFAALWNILAYIILLKRYLNHENLDEFHITLAWCLGYTLIFLVYSISRFRSAEICDAANGLVNLLNSEKGR